MAVVSMSYLLEAGVHFGHQTKRWNPKMKPYIFTARDDIHIINLQKTVECLETSYEAIKEIAANGGTFLFVGTKKQASEVSKEEAERSNSHYVTERWLGGTLTNFRTIRRRVKRLEEIESLEKNGTFEVLPKKEVIGLKKEYDKLIRVLGGIREMHKLPQGLIIVDPKKELNAIREARKLNIPVFGVVDTNCDPDDVDYVIPGNDDAVRAVKVILGVLANAICEAKGLELIDYITEDENKGKRIDPVIEQAVTLKETKVEVKKEVEIKEEKPEPQKIELEVKKEEIKVETPKEVEVKEETVKEKPLKKEKKEETDYSGMTLTELKTIAKDKGLKGYSTLKKDELIKLLNK